MTQTIWQHPDWTKMERPALPGSPASLQHSMPVRVRFAAVGVFVSLVGNLGNALVVADLPEIQGNLSLTPVQGQWLLAAYVMVACWANLILFKFRMQFGIRAFAQLGLLAYASLCLVEVFVADYPTALAARAACGLATPPCSALGSLYLIQCAGQGKNIPRGAMAGISISQFATPIAYILAPSLVNSAEPGLQYLLESGLALCALAAVFLVPLPYSERVNVFQWADAASIAFLAPGLALFVAVLSQGRLQWWTEKPWIGLALAGGLVLVLIGLALESRRASPLLYVRWMKSPDVLLFAGGALFVRFLTIEQQVGAVALLRTLGNGPDQLAPLYGVVLASMLVGYGLIVFFANPRTARVLLIVAVVSMLIGCLLDRVSSPLVAPQDFYISQALVGFGSLIFIGPLLFLGITRIMRAGPQYAITLIVLFVFTQSIGLLLGSAVLGTYQQFREHEWSGVVTATVDPTDPIVQQRLALQGRLFQSVITDPALRTVEGTVQLAHTATLNASVLAYDDVFLLMATVAILVLVWMTSDTVVRRLSARRKGAKA